MRKNLFYLSAAASFIMPFIFWNMTMFESYKGPITGGKMIDLVNQSNDSSFGLLLFVIFPLLNAVMSLIFSNKRGSIIIPFICSLLNYIPLLMYMPEDEGMKYGNGAIVFLILALASSAFIFIGKNFDNETEEENEEETEEESKVEEETDK